MARCFPVNDEKNAEMKRILAFSNFQHSDFSRVNPSIVYAMELTPDEVYARYCINELRYSPEWLDMLDRRANRQKDWASWSRLITKVKSDTRKHLIARAGQPAKSNPRSWENIPELVAAAASSTEDAIARACTQF